MNLRDAAFQAAFSRLFVYNILFEDAEVDERFLGVNEDSRVLSITGAGCGVAGLVSRQPRTVDAVDINPHHLALTALKVTAAQRLFPYSSFYDLFGRGWAADPKQVIGQISDDLPRWVARYWRKHSDRFEQCIYHQGLTAQVIHQLRSLAGIDAGWLRALVHQPVEVRTRAVDEWIGPVLRNPLVKAFLNSPVQLIALGVNYTQRDRALELEQTDLVSFFLRHLHRVAETDIETNWFAWLFLAGQYNHEHPDAVPPYLRRDRYENSLHAPTHVKYHNRNLFDVLGQGGSNEWTHYTLCDAPDWMPAETQRSLLNEIRRTSRDGAIVLYRTVHDDCMVSRLGLDKTFHPLAEESRIASELDRSRQYRHVHFYQVRH